MLRVSIEDLYKQELEFYTHKIAEGNITPLVFELLKDTEDMEGLLEYLGYKTKKHLSENKMIKERTSFSDMFENGVEVI